MQRKALIINLRIKLKKKEKPNQLLRYNLKEFRENPRKINKIYTNETKTYKTGKQYTIN